jgi:DNA-binding Lrp family transcriptional regulator
MTPQEKAKDLFNKFYLVNSESLELETGEYDLVLSLDVRDAKQCALIAVDEILSINSVDKDEDLSNYWESVKQEIENL